VSGVGVGAGLPVERFQAAILGWFDAEGRRLAFRGTRDPYLVLVSEAILQQTQISRGVPAWQAFSARFPTVEALAAASPAEVLRAWRGLGYNRRAINLQRAARVVVNELGGAFPRDVAGLERLPGVGPYTARAVAAIAFGLPVGAVDTNVRRVLGRVIGDPADGARPLTQARSQATADGLVPADRPGAWTHALMDLGSTVCRPSAPRCPACPVRTMCRFAGQASAPMAEPSRPSRKPRSAGPPAIPFERTNRWLRGRILDRLRDADGQTWTVLADPIGVHGAGAVAAALTGLTADGLIELEPGVAPPRARLPVA
jgi:A/G-specific adenine glycosylase